jgi:protoporphyrinogen oxidase
LTKKTNGIIFSKKQKISAILKNEEYYTILAPYKKDQTAPNQKILLNELKKITNNDNIEITCFKNWDYGLPTCSPKMFKYQQKIIEITNQYDNFAICGDFMGLPSLDACVESAKKAVLKIEKNNP